jgi:hypothetical protein
MKAHIIRFIGFCLLLGTAGLQSCDLFKADDPKPLTELEKLPPITQAGKNTFGCLVNGKAWVAPTQNDALAFYQQGTLSISGLRHLPTFENIELIVIDNSLSILTGEYPLNQLAQEPLSFASFFSSASCFYEEENTLTGKLTITKIDDVNRVVSGTFEFTTELPNCERIVITHGRFDINYVP